MVKSQAMTSFLDAMSQAMYGRSRSESIAQGICVMCGEQAVLFSDELSVKEFYISGMCQKCQNSAFGVDNSE